jgi:hypothetical protein
MLYLKLVFLVFATVVALALFTYVWAVARIPGTKWFSTKGQTGIDIYGISSLTLHSPLYWLLALAILAASGWLCRRWVFAA